MKRALFIGNSFLYYGGLVENRDRVTPLSDAGFFYRLCRAAGMDMQVVNLAHGNHNLYDFAGTCREDPTHGDHLAELADAAAFDYVFLSESGSRDPRAAEVGTTAENYLRLRRRLTDAGCTGRFFFLVHNYFYPHGSASGKNWGEHIRAVADGIHAAHPEDGVIDWGRLIDGLVAGEIIPPGHDPSVRYGLYSFVVHQSAKDGYHPNMLTGYLSALMVLHAALDVPVTELDAPVWQAVHPNDMPSPEAYAARYCTLPGDGTSFTDIFGNSQELRALRALVDQTPNG